MRLRDPTMWMWGDALERLENAERLHRQFFQLGCHGHACPSWEPPVDIFETAQQLTVFVALPGVNAEQLVVSLDGATVFVRGTLSMPDTGANAKILRLEIPYGRFERRIELPAQQYELGQRLLHNGCLVLVLSKQNQP